MEVSEFLIDEEKSMIEAMQQLDKLAKKVLFVIRDKKFVASITDGDIRRWILKKGSLDAKVREIANYSPKSLHINEKASAREFMIKHSIEALPILDMDNSITSVVFKNNEEVGAEGNLNIPVVIMAGGLGTRLYPYTKILPKPLIPIGEIPIVEHIINRFNRFGVSNFYLIVNHKKNMIKSYFNEFEKPYLIEYADEDTPLGTGGGLSLLKDKINSTFILTNCDILIDENYEKIFNFHKKKGNLITMVCSLKNIKIPYGVIEISETGEIENIKEKPELSFFSIGFPEIIEYYRNQGQRVGVFPISENSWMDMGQLDEMDDMRRRLEVKD